MQFFPASIKNYLVATMACLSVPGIGVLSYLAYSSFEQVQINARLTTLVEADRALLLASDALLTNRGGAQTSIQGAEDPVPALRQIEQLNKTRIAEAITRLRATDLPERTALIDGVLEQEKLNEERAKALYAEAAKPKAQRSLAATLPWYNGSGAVENALQTASTATSNAARMADPVLADLQAFKSAAWTVRFNYGVQCALLRPAFGSGRQLESAEYRRLGELRGASGAGLRQLGQLGSRPGVDKELIAKAGVLTSKVEAAVRGADQVIGKLGQNAGPVIAAEDWTQQCNAPFDSIVAAVTQPLDDMEKLMQAKLGGAWMRLAVTGGLLAALLAICILSWRGVQRRIARPLVSLKSALDGMQQGDFSQAIPVPPSPDEIGALSGALETYRENALALETNRRDRELAMLADAEQAAHVQKLLREVAGIVAAARDGDFSGQAQVGGMEGPLKELVEGLNEINVVVDSATTEFAEALSAIAGGDLTNRVETAYRGRFADLKGAINETVDRLSATVTTIQTTAADVGLSAREIATGADDLSKRTEEQASSLEESAATTEELAASVKASAQASRQAATTAEEAMRAAEGGGAIAGKAVAAMARIEDASKKISDITRVIDDIAFQTNLLALNAAVEAARAGDAGKGFAVVASEVRTLAQRSGEAAKDISTLISSSNAEVGEGVKLVRQAGDALTQILSASQKVAATIADISSAAAEQANGIDEMSQTVAHMDEMTQANAALSEQSAASANALSGRIVQLNDLVAAFRTSREAVGPSGYPQAFPAAASPARPVKAARIAARPAAFSAPAGGGSEPERLRQMAETAFVQSRAAPAPRKVANGRVQDAGWEEF